MSPRVARHRPGGARGRAALRAERRAFGKPIAHPGNPAEARRHGDPHGRRACSSTGALKYDTGERCDLEAGMAKLFASEAGVENSLEAMRIFGGYSYSVDFDVERYYRDAPLMCIGEGTNEMQRIIITRQLIARNPA
jgi:alkylation response protein AidB-like acyl-CoA dehydrogenase